MGLEVIVDIIKKIIEIFKSLDLIRDPKERFEKVFDPIFQELINVNKNYIDLFKRTIDDLPYFSEQQDSWMIKNPDYDNSNPFVPSTIKTEASNPEYLRAVTSAKKDLVSGADSFETQRDTIRAKAQAFLGKKLDEEEKWFVYGIISYFITPEEKIQEGSGSDGVIEAVIERGGIYALPTPATSAARLIEDEKDTQVIKAVLEEHMKMLLERWSELTYKYAVIRSCKTVAK